jgi:hypothetical protein
VQVLPPGVGAPPGVQQGNVVPMTPQVMPGMAPLAPRVNLNEPMQVPNVGPTG